MNIDNEFVKEKRDEFYLQNSDLIEGGTLREVFTGDFVSIYAAAEVAYAAIPFEESLTKEGFIFIPLKSFEISEILKKEMNIIPILQDKLENNSVTLLNEEYKGKLKELHVKTIANGTQKLTTAMEEEIFKKKQPKL